jgi:transposase
MRKRQVEFIAFLSQLEQKLLVAKTHVYQVMDNLKMHKGKQVRDWLATHPRFVCHFVPVHCSWMNQVEQWFSILQRKRLRISDFASLDHLAERLMVYVSEWNAQAHPFNWSTKSAAKVRSSGCSRSSSLIVGPFQCRAVLRATSLSFLTGLRISF